MMNRLVLIPALLALTSTLVGCGGDPRAGASSSDAGRGGDTSSDASAGDAGRGAAPQAAGAAGTPATAQGAAGDGGGGDAAEAGAGGGGASAAAGADGGGGVEPREGLLSTALTHPTPYVPPQCYTDTEDDEGRVFNTCYTCHTESRDPKLTDDASLQLTYSFPEPAATNPWTNLFEDRSERTAAISDEAMLSYVRESNYLDQDGGIILARLLRDLPEAWDYDADGAWAGYLPDCYFDFDEQGFDHDPEGEITGWRSFAFYPFPGTHWPAAGAMADALVRLPPVFRTVNGELDLNTYALNLTIVEALIKHRDIAIPATDEGLYGVDLDRDGTQGVATRVAFDWAPLEGREMQYVGDALEAQEAGSVQLAGGLFPVDTEFLSSLRYLDVSENGSPQLSARFKELRYAKKHYWQTYSQLSDATLADVKERHDFPDRTELPIGQFETGIGNGSGWQLQGFIEDATGALRPQTFEETAFCMGCHGGLGATTDSIFSMARKLDVGASRRGWYHWSQEGIEGINEPKIAREGTGAHYEYSYYLMYSGGDELRSNEELLSRFFDAEGVVDQAMAEALHRDISVLLMPSPERALALDKDYKIIVEEQSYVRGRTPLVTPAAHVHQDALAQEEPTGVGSAVRLTEAGRELWHDTSPLGTGEVGSELRAAIVGEGMAGPDGHAYGIEWTGVIAKSRYLDSSRIFFPFPRRDTLPVRYVVQNGSNPACYTCHRIASPTVPGTPPSEPLALPATTTPEPGLALTQLTTDAAADTGAMWSPDGQHIAWVSMRSGTAQIWVMDADGAHKAALTSGETTHSWPKWSSASDRLVFWAYDPETTEAAIHVSAIDGSSDVTIVSSALGLEGAELSPDGSYVAYSAEGAEGWDIWIAPSDGSSAPVRVTDDSQSETTPLWRPEANPPELAYKACASGTYGLCTEEILQFSSGLESTPSIYTWQGPHSIQGYQWSRDGSRLAYTAEILTHASGEDRISYQVVVDLIELGVDGATVNAPVIPSNGVTLSDRGPVFSPDGSRVAYWAWDRSYRATLWLANVDGTHLRQITREGFDLYPTWSADGTRLAFESSRSGNSDIWLVQLD